MQDLVERLDTQNVVLILSVLANLLLTATAMLVVAPLAIVVMILMRPVQVDSLRMVGFLLI